MNLAINTVYSFAFNRVPSPSNAKLIMSYE